MRSEAQRLKHHPQLAGETRNWGSSSLLRGPRYMDGVHLHYAACTDFGSLSSAVVQDSRASIPSLMAAGWLEGMSSFQKKQMSIYYCTLAIILTGVRTDVRREVLRQASCLPEDKTYLLAEHSCWKNGLEPLSAQAHRCHIYIYYACRRHLVSNWLSVCSLHFLWSSLLWCASCSNQSKRSASNTW